MRLARHNLAVAEKVLDALAEGISGRDDIPAEVHISLASAYISLAVATHELAAAGSWLLVY